MDNDYASTPIHPTRAHSHPTRAHTHTDALFISSADNTCTCGHRNLITAVT